MSRELSAYMRQDLADDIAQMVDPKNILRKIQDPMEIMELEREIKKFKKDLMTRLVEEHLKEIGDPILLIKRILYLNSSIMFYHRDSYYIYDAWKITAVFCYVSMCNRKLRISLKFYYDNGKINSGSMTQHHMRRYKCEILVPFSPNNYFVSNTTNWNNLQNNYLFRFYHT